jgi:hypothetical protein
MTAFRDSLRNYLLLPILILSLFSLLYRLVTILRSDGKSKAASSRRRFAPGVACCNFGIPSKMYDPRCYISPRRTERSALYNPQSPSTLLLSLTVHALSRSGNSETHPCPWAICVTNSYQDFGIPSVTARVALHQFALPSPQISYSDTFIKRLDYRPAQAFACSQISGFPPSSRGSIARSRTQHPSFNWAAHTGPSWLPVVAAFGLKGGPSARTTSSDARVFSPFTT